MVRVIQGSSSWAIYAAWSGMTRGKDWGDGFLEAPGTAKSIPELRG